MRVEYRDALEGLKALDASSADLVIADPPYYRIWGDFDFGFPTVEAYLDWVRLWVLEIHRVMKPTASFYLWGKIGFGNGYPLFRVCDWIEREGLLTVVNWITQRNTRGRGTKRGFMEAREELVLMVKGQGYTWNPAYTTERSTRTDPGFDGKPRGNTHKRASDVWVDIAEASQSSRQRFTLEDGTRFPTVKPLAACHRIIEASSNPGDMVVIPFAGSGSECVAAVELGRAFVAFEVDPRHYNLARQRVALALKEVSP